jgi:uncharacterized protein YegL
VKLCIISFSDDARIEVPLTNLMEVLPPQLTPRGGTRFAPALQLLRSTISRDVEALKGEGFRVYRPVVFFFTDGVPGDSPSAWRTELEQLLESRIHPTIIAVGIGGADPAILHRLAGVDGRSYISSPNRTPEQVVSGFGDLMVGALNSLTSSQASGQPLWRIPKVQELDTPPDAFFL